MQYLRKDIKYFFFKKIYEFRLSKYQTIILILGRRARKIRNSSEQIPGRDLEMIFSLQFMKLYAEQF